MRFVTLSVLTLALFLSGCATSTTIRVGELKPPDQPADMNVFMLKQATDARSSPGDQVGRQTISLLMIPGPAVTARDIPLSEAVGNHAKTALETAGYNVTPVANVNDAVGPVVVVQIDDLRNYQFTWVYPLGFLWGKMDMTLLLVNPEADVLWKTQTKGHGGIWGSFIYMTGFGWRVKSDLTANLNQIIEITSSKEFKDILRQAQGGQTVD